MLKISQLFGMYGLKYSLLFLGFATPFIYTPAYAGNDDISSADKRNIPTALLEKSSAGNKVLVSVGLEVGTSTAPGETPSQRAARYNRLQQEVLSSLPAGSFKEKRRFHLIPYMSLWVDEHALLALAAHRNVTSLMELIPAPPILSSSTDLINAPEAWALGATGEGQVVAILDTGIQSTHPFLAEKVVSEACYSTNYGSVTTGCPNGDTTQVGEGAGTHLPSNVDGYSHGTHVAGIVAGVSGGDLSGVAPKAQLISIQVFSIENNSDICDSWGHPTPCALSYPDDQAAGLQRIYELSTQIPIAAANMSLGGGGYSSYCDDTESLRKSAIDQLRSVNIATVIASGNNGYSDMISSPACISSAVAVGATNNLDTIESFSNSASILDLLAPGSLIYSSLPTNSYGYASGTSMAAPHVAGAFAVLKGAQPYRTVSDLESALQSTGKPILDTRNGIIKPRIDVNAALSLMKMEHWATQQGGFWNEQQWFTGDFNGDGYMDVGKAFSDGGLASIDIHISNGNSFSKERWATKQGGFWDTQQWFVGDFNGDGKDDVAKVFDSSGLASIDVHISNGSSFTIQRWATQQGGFWDTQQWFTGDFNGDGKDDVAKAFDDYGLASIDVHISNGSSFAIQRWASRQGGFWDTQQWFAGDFNGDGKDDVAKAFNDSGSGLASIDVHVSNGSSFAIQRWASRQGGFSDTQQWFAGDFNGDGKDDVAKAFNDYGLASIDVHVSNSSGFAIQRWATKQGGFWDTQQWFAGDFNGDGKDDAGKAFDDGGQASIDVHRSL